MAIFWKDNILKFFGFTLLFIGLFVMFIGIAMHLDVPSEKNGIPIAVASFIFTAPGLIMIYLGKKAHVKEVKVKAVANIIKSHRRIKIAAISKKMAIPEIEVEQHLSTALSKKMIRGFIDRTTDEFVTEEGMKHDVQTRFCGNCGAPFEKVYLKGETIKCKSCGSIL